MTDAADRRKALNARRGDQVAVRRRIDAMKATTDDWYTTCRKCGKQRRGTLAQLKTKHECEVNDVA